MGDFLDKLSPLIPKNDEGGVPIPGHIKDNLTKIGEKGGQKYSDFVDFVVDSLFKRNK